MLMSTNTNENNILHIGFDDTDSKFGRCTTHLAFKLVSYLNKKDVKFLDYPLLIRLNPNIPWKTRGNGAVCLRIIMTKGNNSENIFDFIKNEIEKNSAIGKGANPGLVCLRSKEIPNEIKEFNRLAMFDILSKQKATKIAQKYNLKHVGFGNGQGLVGAMAAIGCLLTSDHTFEILAYRKIKSCGTSRIIDPINVMRLHDATFPSTFNSYDHINKRILILPHGSDPVFCGIRGEDPQVLYNSLKILNIKEELEGYMIYRSNQGTGMHLQNELKFSMIKSFTAGYSRCIIVTNPQVIQGGHVLFIVEDNSKNTCWAAVYEPTGLTKIASQLHRGDQIEIGFGVRKATSKHPKVLNIEYIFIHQLVQIYNTVNPVCKDCRKRMKSEGKNKGFQCKKCKRIDKTNKKIFLLKTRLIKEGLYIPALKAHRHLTKPLHRYGKEKTKFFESGNVKLYPKWFEKFR
jgi:tRNA(Ile2)-agmatinylcytidine synthase